MNQHRDREWGDDGEIDPFKGVLFLWGARYLAVAWTLAGAVIGFALVRLIPPTYVAAANVLVTVPVALSNVVPDPTDVDAIDRLAKSEAIHALVNAELTPEFLSQGETIGSTRTAVDKSLIDPRPSLSTLTLTVTASSPELARRAADTWVTIVVKEDARLATRTRAAATEFFSRQLKQATDRLVDRQRALDQARRQHANDLALAIAEVDNAKADFKRAGKRFDEAQLVMADREAAVSAGSPAAPARVVTLPSVRFAAIGAALGFSLALFIAWVRSRLRAG